MKTIWVYPSSSRAGCCATDDWKGSTVEMTGWRKLGTGQEVVGTTDLEQARWSRCLCFYRSTAGTPFPIVPDAPAVALGIKL